METMEAWAPTIVALAFLGLAIFMIRQMITGSKMQNEAEVKKLEARLVKDEGDYLTEEKHGLLCSNAQLELKAHITAVLTQTKDEIFDELRAIKDMIKKGG